MSAAWFLAWLGEVVPLPVYLAVLFGVPIAVVVWSWWEQRGRAR